MSQSSDSLTQLAGKAAIWQLLGGGWITLIRLGASAVLARYLTPTDFGIFAIAILVYEFVIYTGAVGMSSGIIAKKEVNDDDLCTLFWSMAVVRFLMFIACYVLAPYAGQFFNNDLVVDVLRLLSFVFLITIIDSVSVTLLNKELRFSKINVIRSVAVIVESGSAIYFAVSLEMGYWALVASMLFGSLLTSLTFFIAAGWWPKLKFSKQSFDYLFKFGINNLGFSITNYLNQNLDYLLVGKILGVRALGLYEFAYRIPHLIQLRIVQPLGQVIFPSLAKIVDNDDRLIAGYIQAEKFIILIAFPMIAGLGAIADLMVLVLWGSQWVEIIVPLQILSLCALLRVIPQASGAVLLCKQRPDLPFKISLVGLIFTSCIVGGLGYLYGILGVAWGMVISVIPSYLAVYYSFKLTSGSVGDLIIAIWPILFATLLCAASAYFTKLFLISNDINMVVSLCSSIVVGATLYVLTLARVFPSYTRDIIVTIEQVTGKPVGNKVQWIFPGGV